MKEVSIEMTVPTYVIKKTTYQNPPKQTKKTYHNTANHSGPKNALTTIGNIHIST